LLASLILYQLLGTAQTYKSMNTTYTVSLLSLVFGLQLLLFSGLQAQEKPDWQTPNPTPPPSWINDLVIYELSTISFTSPNGQGEGYGTGTWNSLADNLEYIADLGATGIWLSGHCLANTHFGCHTPYAVVEPDKLDPIFGSEEDFKAMVEKAHSLGLKIFLESITHGVVKESPLLTEHPDWFKGESWGMHDFDYTNQEFLDWWIQLHVDYVQKYGVDGFRLDGPNGTQGWGYEGMSVLEPWDEITRRCAESGDSIVVFGENARYHFAQLAHWTKEDLLPLVNEIRDVAAFDQRPILSGNPPMELDPEKLQYISYEISCHDNGANNKHGLTLMGSRCRFGYYAMYAPYIPIFYSGDEFLFYKDSTILNEEGDMVTIPYPSKYLPCIKDWWDGWWAAAQIDLSLIEKEPHRSMHADCRKILQIRNENRDIFHNDRFNTHMVSIDASPEKPKPYVRYIPGEKAIVVLGNDTRKDMVFKLDIPLEVMGFEGEKYRVHYLWTGEQKVVNAKALNRLKVQVPADYEPGGGVRLVKIEPVKS